MIASINDPLTDGGMPPVEGTVRLPVCQWIMLATGSIRSQFNAPEIGWHSRGDDYIFNDGFVALALRVSW